ncbi:hypothetical protein ACMZ5D_11985, partial [Acinetobacter baumannii]
PPPPPPPPYFQAEDGIRDVSVGLVGSEMCIRDRFRPLQSERIFEMLRGFSSFAKCCLHQRSAQ